MRKILFLQGFLVFLLLNGTLQSDFLRQSNHPPSLSASPSFPSLPRPTDPSIGISSIQRSNSLLNQSKFNTSLSGLIFLLFGYAFLFLFGRGFVWACNWIRLSFCKDTCVYCSETGGLANDCTSCQKTFICKVGDWIGSCCDRFLYVSQAMHLREVAKHHADDQQYQPAPDILNMS